MGRRMGGVDKGLVELDGQPMVAHVLARLAPQVGALLINANQNAERYAAFGYPVVADAVGGFAGPLAGLHAGMTRRDDALRRHRAVRFAVPAAGSRRAPGRRARRATTRNSPSRRRSTSRIRCSRSCAATCCRTWRRSSKAADARSTRGTPRCASSTCRSTTRTPRFATSTRPTNLPPRQRRRRALKPRQRRMHRNRSQPHSAARAPRRRLVPPRTAARRRGVSRAHDPLAAAIAAHVTLAFHRSALTSRRSPRTSACRRALAAAARRHERRDAVAAQWLYLRVTRGRALWPSCTTGSIAAYWRRPCATTFARAAPHARRGAQRRRLHRRSPALRSNCPSRCRDSAHAVV